MDRENDIYRRAATLFCICAYGALFFFGVRFLLIPALPVLAAFAVSAVISNTAKKLGGITGLPRGFIAFLLVSLLLFACCGCVFFLARTLLSELSAAISFFSAGESREVLASLEKLPLVGELFARSEEYASLEIAPLIARALSSLAASLGGALAATLKATPAAVGNAVFFVMCVYYMSMDFDKIKKALTCRLPSAIRQKGGALLSVCVRFLRSYLRLFLLTFFELLVGLFIICPRFALLGALCIAALDILPVIGAGLVLIPWAVVSFAVGNTFAGVGLCVLYAVISIVRRIVEPKVIGNQMGLSPVAVLVSMYLGYKLFGTLGLLLSPLAAAGMRPTFFEKKVGKKAS